MVVQVVWGREVVVEGEGGNNLLLLAACSVLVSLFCADVYLSCPALLRGALYLLLVDGFAYLSASSLVLVSAGMQT